MHFVLAWDCPEASPERLLELDRLFDALLADYESVKIFDRVRAVKVMGNGVYEYIQMNLLQSAKKQPETVTFVMSPLTSRGTFHGRLPAEQVEGLQKLVQQ